MIKTLFRSSLLQSSIAVAAFAAICFSAPLAPWAHSPETAYVYQADVQTHPSQGDVRVIEGAKATLMTTKAGAFAFNCMYHAEQGFLAATSEWLSLYIDLRVRRVAAMPEPILARLESLMQAHRRLPVPPEAGRVIRIPNAPVA